MSVWKIEDIFSTAHTNLLHWLKMLCLRAIGHVWTDISQINEFILQCFKTISTIYCSYFLLNSTLSFLQYSVCLFYTYLPCWLMMTNKLWTVL